MSHHITVEIKEKWDGLTVHELFHNIWQAPKKFIHNIRMNHSVTRHGVPLQMSTKLRTGDVIVITLPKDSIDVGGTPLPLDVLFEDEHILIVNKRPGIPIHPNDEFEKHTLLHAAAFYIQQKNEPVSLRHIHRLDQDTSGAVILAKHRLSYALMSQMLEQQHIERVYWALVKGKLVGNDTISNPIGRDRHHPTRRRVSKTGQVAVTHYQSLQYFKKENLTLVECKLETGRTHQIRVHLSSIGHPIAGDDLYRGPMLFHRQALHARKLSFVHPITLKKLSIVAPFTDDPPIFEKMKIH